MKTVPLVLSCCLWFALTGCTPPSQTKTEKRILTVTIEPLRYLVDAIAGDLYTIQTMVPQGGNPETYEPKPSEISKLQESTAYFQIGELGFEKAWLGKLTSESPHLLICNTSQGINLIGHDDHFDPHIWASPQNMSVMAQNIYNLLATIDKQNMSVYRENHDKLQARIRDVDDSIKTILGTKSLNFMIFHPTLSYFARDYRLRQIAIEEHGKEPSAMRMKDLIIEAKKEKVKLVLVQQEFDERYAELIAQQIQARIVTINPLSYDWEEEIIQIAHIIRNGAEPAN